MNPNKKCLRVVYQIYFFLVGLILLIISAILYSNSNDKVTDFKYLASNWK